MLSLPSYVPRICNLEGNPGVGSGPLLGNAADVLHARDAETSWKSPASNGVKQGDLEASDPECEEILGRP